MDSSAIFLSIPKVGCSFIGTLTQEITKCKNMRYHVPVDNYVPTNFYYLNVRNPWDHYVSKWQWTAKTGSSAVLTCMKAVHDITEMKKDFNLYLTTLLTCDRAIFKAGNKSFYYNYSKSPLNYLGLYSYRNVYFIDIRNTSLNYNLEELEDYYIGKYLDTGILWPLRFTHLYDDFCYMIKENQEKFLLKSGWEKTLESYEQYRNPRDVSGPNGFFKIYRKKNDDYRDYYSDELAELVAEKEKFMIDLYNFDFDDYEKDKKETKWLTQP